LTFEPPRNPFGMHTTRLRSVGHNSKTDAFANSDTSTPKTQQLDSLLQQPLRLFSALRRWGLRRSQSAPLGRKHVQRVVKEAAEDYLQRSELQTTRLALGTALFGLLVFVAGVGIGLQRFTQLPLHPTPPLIPLRSLQHVTPPTNPHTHPPAPMPTGAYPWLLPSVYLLFAATALPWRIYTFAVVNPRNTFFLLDLW
jgi:hypothetical protein